MKTKNLKKKIRLLEARLKKDTKKLTKLKRKLGAATTAELGKTKKKSADRAAEARPQQEKGRSTKPRATPAAGKTGSAAIKVKRKLNLSPERRAQLAAAMKARWAAKRATAGESPQDTTTDRDFTLGQVPQTP